jgi:uncharacterized membrane protein YgdD (TMEM256/DUF423 family)
MTFEKTSQLWTVVGAIYGFMAVACGAFGAHALQSRLDARLLQIWHTASHYQMAHALALVALGSWLSSNPGQNANVAGVGFSVGTLIFSGSLYLLALTDIRWLGAITPIGGTLFLTGWLSWAWIAWRA